MKALLIGVALVLVILGFTLADGLRPRADATGSSAGLPPAAVVTPPATAPASTPQPAAGQAVAPKPRLAVAFRLPPELTQSLYMGERWVSPPSYSFAQQGSQFVVKAKVQEIDSSGERVDLSGDWAASDPEMVALTRGSGEVTIVVRQPGESTLTVSTGIGSKTLSVSARQTVDAMQVAITQ